MKRQTDENTEDIGQVTGALIESLVTYEST